MKYGILVITASPFRGCRLVFYVFYGKTIQTLFPSFLNKNDMEVQTQKPKRIVLQKPFDAHMHWRQKSGLLNQVAKYSIAEFSGGLLMPNTDPKVIGYHDLQWYRKEVYEVIDTAPFFPIFTFYLSPELSVHDILTARLRGEVHAVKYYPRGGTTNSDRGVEGFRGLRHILEKMQEIRLPLLIHGETPELNGEVAVDNEREHLFLHMEMESLVHEFPELPIVLEHITTKEAADFVLAHENVRATITPQHCLLDDRAFMNGFSVVDRKFRFNIGKNGSNPSVVCRPVLKHRREVEGIQQALQLQAATGLKKFGLGTDTAPHSAEKKYCECGACGVFSAPIALELYAIAFEQMGILDHLPVFASEVMPAFYGITDLLPEKEIVLIPEEQTVRQYYDGVVTPFAGQVIPWTAVRS